MLRFTTFDYNDIRRHGEEAYPNECCGILLGTPDGKARRVQSVLRCNNCADEPQTCYQIDGRDLARAQREARDRGLAIIGFYHSHPDHPAIWSPSDLEGAHWIGCSYVITSVERAKAVRTNSFALTGSREDDKAMIEEPVVIEA